MICRILTSHWPMLACMSITHLYYDKVVAAHLYRDKVCRMQLYRTPYSDDVTCHDQCLQHLQNRDYFQVIPSRLLSAPTLPCITHHPQMLSPFPSAHLFQVFTLHWLVPTLPWCTPWSSCPPTTMRLHASSVLDKHALSCIPPAQISHLSSPSGSPSPFHPLMLESLDPHQKYPNPHSRYYHKTRLSSPQLPLPYPS